MSYTKVALCHIYYHRLDLSGPSLDCHRGHSHSSLAWQRPRRAGELAADCAMSNPAMSRHLRVLRASGLVEVAAEPADQDARVRVYRLRSEPFVALQAWLDQVQAFWAGQLNAFKGHVERTRRGEDL